MMAEDPMKTPVGRATHYVVQTLTETSCGMDMITNYSGAKATNDTREVTCVICLARMGQVD